MDLHINMERILLIDSDLSTVDDELNEKLEGSESAYYGDDDDDCDNTDDETDDESDYEIIDGWDYIVRYGKDAWEKLYQARLAHRRNIVLREFTRRLPDVSEQTKNALFDIFSESTAFGPMEHNKLMEALADPEKGWSLREY